MPNPSVGPPARFLAVLLLALPLTGRAQDPPVVTERERVSLERPEGWAMAYMGSATLFQGFGEPGRATAGDFRLGAELGSIPHLGREQTRVGFDGTKFEDLNKSPVFGRVRAWVGLPAGFALEVAWTPPVSINGARPDGIYGLALERRLFQRGRWRGGARLFTQNGRIRGDITCPTAIAAEPPGSEANPFGCRAPSDDVFHVDIHGIELSGAYSGGEGRPEPFGSITFTRLDAEARVNARVFGVVDRSVRSTSGTLRTIRVGVSHRPAARWEWLASVDYTPLDVRRPPDRERDDDPFWSLRLMLRYRF